MVILATYGYKQSQVFNINCRVAPLLDIIRRTSHSDIIKLLQGRQDQILKEVSDLTSLLELKEKKLHLLENPATPAEESKDLPAEPVVKTKSSKDLKKFPKSSHAQAEAKRLEEEKKKAEEEARRVEEAKKAEEDKKRAEEEKKKKKEEVKKPVKKEEVKELSPEELKFQQIESQKVELRRIIEDSSKRKIKLQEKLEMIQASLERFSASPKEIDLVDQGSTRKFLSTREEEVASKILNTRSVYSVVVIENDSFNPYEINGFCIRTIEEDANFVEEVDTKNKGKPKTAAKKK